MENLNEVFSSNEETYTTKKGDVAIIFNADGEISLHLPNKGIDPKDKKKMTKNASMALRVFLAIQNPNVMNGINGWYENFSKELTKNKEN